MTTINKKKKFIFYPRVDPRSKLLLLMLISIFAFGGAGGNGPIMISLRHLLVLLPLVFLWMEGKKNEVILVVILYGLFYMIQMTFWTSTHGLLHYILLFSIGFFVRILPSAMAGYYLITTTKTNELILALQKMHVSRNLIIPVTVIFRFFPVVLEESQAVLDAIRMRGIRLGTTNLFKVIEYRMIPMITCSVKVGEDLTISALARGLGSPMKRTNICTIGFHPIDLVVFMTAGMILITIGIDFI